MSLQLVADRAGLSKGFLSMIENGQRRLERRQHIAAIAEALQVSVADLTGQPFAPADPTRGGAHATVPDVRLALMGSSLDYAEHDPSRPVGQLVEDTAAVQNLFQACQYEQVGRRLIQLLPDLHVAAVRAPERESALQSIVLACQAATFWLKSLGYTDLAWIAADRGWQAALRLDDPLWISAADFARTQALSGLGAYRQLASIASRAAEATPRNHQQGLEICGMHRLTQALAAATTGSGDVTDALAEARAIAARTGQGSAFWLMFGPVNTALWEMSIAMERGDPGHTIEVASTVSAMDIPTQSRRAAYYTDYGVALSMVKGRDREAVEVLRQAEQLEPDRVRNHPVAREAVDGMLQRARRDAGGRNLRGLAHRMGIAP
jgi:transcriptional regulator with XRE-family HTH domain